MKFVIVDVLIKDKHEIIWLFFPGVSYVERTASERLRVWS